MGPQLRARDGPPLLFFRWFSVLVLLFATVWFVWRTLHWPLTGDASLMHYVAFLLDHGWRPYRDIGDMNLPGAYLPDWIVIHTLGAGSLAWRCYDLFLLAIATVAIPLCVRPASWLVGLWAALLFVLIHARDGMAQAGQRDLTVAVLLLVAEASLSFATPRKRFWPCLLFGLCVGSASTIKPTALPFLLVAVPGLWSLRKERRETTPRIAAIAQGFLLPLSVAVAWLARHDAIPGFLRSETLLAAYHANLGRRPPGYLLQHGFSPILPLAVAGTLLVAANLFDSWHDQRAMQKSNLTALCTALLVGMVAYLVQGKGYPYQRYTFLAFLLILIARSIVEEPDRASWLRWLSAITMAAAALLLGVPSAVMAGQYRWSAPSFESILAADLAAIESKEPGAVQDRIQCLDTASGCVATLYNLQRVQATGLLYDEFLFHEESVKAVEESRRKFWQDLQAHPPRLFVVTDTLFPTGPGHYEKLARWPEFYQWLAAHYTLVLERPPGELIRLGGPATRSAGYRLYLHSEVFAKP